MTDPTKPLLTTAMIAEDKAMGTSPPGAGGWTPSPAQRALGIALVSTLGGLALSLPALLPGKAGMVAAAVCSALALGIAAGLGMQSAGPRSAA